MPSGMSHRQRVVDLVSDLANPVALDLGVELVDVDYLREGGRNILRITIDRDGGVTHDDCQALSNGVSEKLDELDPIPDAYYLEVTSPGVERPLKKDSDYVRFTGREVALHLFAAHEGRKLWQGVLRGLEGDEVVLETKTGSQRLPRKLISRAHLVFHFN